MCEYCESDKPLFSDWGAEELEVWIDGEGLSVADQRGYIWCIEVAYCPMCGRELNGGER